MGSYTFKPGEDQHIRRAGSDYAHQLLALLPRGQAWPKEPVSTLWRACHGLAEYWGFVDGRAADLLERESDPRKTIELLPDWERAWGLPDPCFPSATTIGERQRMLVMIMTWMGGQSREYFKRVAEWVGYTIEIKEFAPFMCGISQVGDTRAPPPSSPIEDQNFRWYIGPAEQRFYWEVSVGQVGLIWFRAASGQAGVDPHLKFSIPTELICLLERWKPAHTSIVPDFSKLAFGGPMQGTP
jgi:uncharacterized protein YmfQ (DUF2313 family)